MVNKKEIVDNSVVTFLMAVTIPFTIAIIMIMFQRIFLPVISSKDSLGVCIMIISICVPFLVFGFGFALATKGVEYAEECAVLCVGMGVIVTGAIVVVLSGFFIGAMVFTGLAGLLL